MSSLHPTPGISQEMDSVSKKDLGHPIKLSVVDDDGNDLSLMTRAVDQSPDLEMVGSYTSGSDALRGIPSSASQVVLMDVRMPGMSGIEVTKRLKEVRPALFIFLISGFDA